MLDDRTEREFPPEPGSESEDEQEVTAVGPWQDVIRGLAGASKPRNLMPAEVVAVREWAAALEGELAETPNAAALALLSSLGRLALLELRLSRNVFEKGVVVRDGGEVKGTLVELRQLIRLKSDLLGRLDFRRDPKNIPGIRETWARTVPAAPRSDGDGGNGVSVAPPKQSPPRATQRAEDATPAPVRPAIVQTCANGGGVPSPRLPLGPPPPPLTPLPAHLADTLGPDPEGID